MKKRYWLLLVIIISLIIGYFLGPVPPEPEYSNELPVLATDLKILERDINASEDSMPVRKDNQARIIWQNNLQKKTEYSLIYLHGFAGSYRDGYPVNQNIADTLNANLFLSRWAGHGLIPPASLDNFTPENAWSSAKEALAIGNRIGDKVIILSTSTGGTLAVKLAAAFPDKVFAIINLSPNFEDDMPGTFVLNSPWGYDIAKLISFGESKKISHKKPIARQYWDTIYPAKALVDLQVLVQSTVKKEILYKVECPVLTLYYHENFLEEDQHVEVSVYPEIYKKLGTPDSLKVLRSLKTPGTHFIGSDIKSKDTQIVEEEIVSFLKKTLKINLDSIN
ncbi:alpha/beta hydrolase [Christiangramia salexigens]|uniref:Uncharacterized protein n=1 Tax=Christiangramia salexigens TaxID=1913577 RepID=A0A1L3J8A6_9FLAO|nr:alpha/beta fold hydrolase [Christiangramia salexigens]APG61355.1 hypothetical protein LPB144_02800 [Christiangramia salexigens]